MRKLLSTILCVMIITAFVGCGNEKTKQTSDNSIEKKVETNKKDIKEDIKEEIKQDEPKFETISKDKTNKIDNYCEFTINSTKFGKKINPPKPNGAYTYYEVKEPGTTYLDTVISIKSLLTEGESADKFLTVKVIYDSKYEYETFSTIEQYGGADFTYTNITSIEPLKKGVVHFIAEIPEEVEKDKKPVAIVINTNNKELRYTLR